MAEHIPPLTRCSLSISPILYPFNLSCLIHGYKVVTLCERQMKMVLGAIPLKIVQNDLVMTIYSTLIHGEDIACLPDLVRFVMMEEQTPEYSFC